MSIFICARCDQVRDSDDGCEEAWESRNGNSLLCVECTILSEEERDFLGIDSGEVA